MFQRPTVFVLGAGSSKEANLPVGAELRTAIVDLLHSQESNLGKFVLRDREIFSAMQRAAAQSGNGPLHSYIEAAVSLSAAMPLALSIDSYLEAHQEDSHKITVGKIAIAKAILDAEASSLLRPARAWDDIDFNRVENTWFVRFMQAATDGVAAADLPNIFNDVSVINFNYDRCLEHFVKNALQVYYDLSDQRATEIANTLYVFHPYGSVGRLPWQESGAGIMFGSRRRGNGLLRIAQSIKTFSERIDEDTELNEMRMRVTNSDQMIFLGFAFHRQNLQLLSSGAVSEPKSVYATAVGISKSDQAVLKDQIHQYMSSVSGTVSVTMVGSTCADIMSDYWRTFTQ